MGWLADVMGREKEPAQKYIPSAATASYFNDGLSCTTGQYIDVVAMGYTPPPPPRPRNRACRYCSRRSDNE